MLCLSLYVSSPLSAFAAQVTSQPAASLVSSVKQAPGMCQQFSPDVMMGQS